MGLVCILGQTKTSRLRGVFPQTAGHRLPPRPAIGGTHISLLTPACRQSFSSVLGRLLFPPEPQLSYS